ncbi:hypothetical protein [Parvibium lacunae]|uniref:PH domain-containing protein n=1 Tax=Parvibium lacunae TaxID=1888893 RepID=A0A368L4T2_9BURK|nr:hypothetical protein [Parvibium lacunae]RCS58584.1 hypothetical protein DU000_07200 [Parvibium lacunae]
MQETDFYAEGPAFSSLLRYLGGVLGALVALRSLSLIVMADLPALPLLGWGLVLGANLIVMITVYYLWTARVRIDQAGIHQDWLFPKTVSWNQIEYAKFIGIPGAQRLVVRLKNGGAMGFLKSFNAGSPLLVARFRAIARAYPFR